tara:strand:+ start:269 stop:637 length:369 start_codon:yes stop_codon:yes gene_type:complete
MSLNFKALYTVELIEENHGETRNFQLMRIDRFPADLGKHISSPYILVKAPSTVRLCSQLEDDNPALEVWESREEAMSAFFDWMKGRPQDRAHFMCTVDLDKTSVNVVRVGASVDSLSLEDDS